MRVKELAIIYRTRLDLPAFDAYQSLATPRQAASFLIPILGQEATEVFGIVCLSTKHHFIAWHEVSRGSLDTTVVHPRDVFKAALLVNAACILGTHNHPSGDPIPSPDDLELTRRLAAAGELMGIPLIDHLIIGDGRYYSFKEGGRL